MKSAVKRVEPRAAAKNDAAANAMPVKLSSRLVGLAKSAANLSDRSLTAQVEHWSILGMQAEKLLAFDQAQALKHADLETNKAQLQAAGEALKALFSNTDRSAALSVIQGDALPVYENDPDRSGGVRQVWPDGRVVLGRLVERIFFPIDL
jgi:hypothetical protein